MSERAPLAYAHAVAVVIGEAGVLVRGPSGAGKTALALALVAEGRRAGRFARLVGDDRVSLTLVHGRLVMRPHPRVAGLAERRGQGVTPEPWEPAAVARCVLDLLADGVAPPRLPEAADQVAVVEGARLPRLALAGGRPAEGARLAFDFLERLPR